MKVCAFCGKEFNPKSNRQKYCEGPHYMTCPVCGNSYVVRDNESLSRDPVACSYTCRGIRSRETTLERHSYSDKAKQSMQKRFGVDYAMQSKELKAKAKRTLLEKYQVDNIQKLDFIAKKSKQTRKERWIQKIHELLPIKLQTKESLPRFSIHDENMQIFILTEKASRAFLQKYGFRLDHKFRKKHLSLGLVDNGILYQVLRFERKKNSIVLADFGIRDGYFNPNYYSKLIEFASEVKGIEEFEAKIPRDVATPEVLESLSLELVEEDDYEVYWKIDDSLRKLTMRDNIEEMLTKFDYVTSDCVDLYVFK